jgi:hypothetical protein
VLDNNNKNTYNKIECNIEYCHLKWGDEKLPSEITNVLYNNQYEYSNVLILGADLLYCTSIVKPLLQTIKTILEIKNQNEYNINKEEASTDINEVKSSTDNNEVKSYVDNDMKSGSNKCILIIRINR